MGTWVTWRLASMGRGILSAFQTRVLLVLAWGPVFFTAWPGSPGFQTAGHDPFVDVSQSWYWQKEMEWNGKGWKCSGCIAYSKEKYSFGRSFHYTRVGVYTGFCYVIWFLTLDPFGKQSSKFLWSKKWGRSISPVILPEKIVALQA